MCLRWWLASAMESMVYQALCSALWMGTNAPGSQSVLSQLTTCLGELSYAQEEEVNHLLKSIVDAQ